MALVGLRASYHRVLGRIEHLLPAKLRPVYNHPAGNTRAVCAKSFHGFLCALCVFIDQYFGVTANMLAASGIRQLSPTLGIFFSL